MINQINGTPVYVTKLNLNNTKMLGVLQSQDIKGNTWFGDSDGKINKPQLHNLPEFKEFNEAIKPHVHTYVRNIMCPKKYQGAKINIYIQKSWGVKIKENGVINPHKHCNGHISLVYYLNTPPGSSSLQFLTDNPFDHYNAFLTAQNQNFPLLNIETNTLVIFPGMCTHAALNNKSKENRWSMSYDLMVTTPEAREFMTLDPKFWKLLD
jgi:uncharacterized protein (TIGR02466 family)